MKERGLIEKELVHLESYFPPSHPLALGLQGQAENIVRTAVLSLALGTTKFEDAWGLDDCGDRWGSQHYGCPGLIGRPPESNPKPAAAAFATMTRVLDLCRYEAWLPTGSRSAFCLRFKGPDRNVYAVWTIHGTRPMEIVPESDSVKLVRIDSQGNEFPLPLKDGVATVALSPAAEWVVALGGGVREARAGKPTYSDAPGEHRVLLENFETGEWRQDGEPHKAFEANHWDVVRKRVPMNVRRVADPERGSTTLEVVLENPDETRPLTGFYAGLVPEAPIPIPGKAKAIGVYGKGISAWSRIVFEVEDAGGERWMSCGLKDAWNSDDIHSRTYLNHDGWRYMEIPLPANAPGDNYRESSTVGWGYDRDGIVDLPLKLVRAFVAMRSKMIYIDELLPVDGTALRLDEIQAVYESPEAMTEKPVEAQKMAANVLVRSRDVAALPNPIAELGAESSGRAAVIEKVYPPEVMQSGDSIYVRIKPVENAKEYRVYVSAYSDGTGAQVMGKPDKEPNVIYIRKLQPSIPIHLFATWIDLDGKESKPSEGRKTILKDEFPFK
jgi:hypothetical protein